MPSSSTASSLGRPMCHASVKRFRQSPSFVVLVCQPSAGLMLASLARAVPTRHGKQSGMRHVAVLWLAWPCVVSQPSMVASSHAAPAADEHMTLDVVVALSYIVRSCHSRAI